MTDKHFTVEDYAGVLVVKFTDQAILETARIDQLGKELYPLAERAKKPKLVIDFSTVKSLSSHMLGILLTLRGKVEAQGGGLALCSLRPEMFRVFQITCLDKVFRFFPSDTDALASFGVHVSKTTQTTDRQEC